ARHPETRGEVFVIALGPAVLERYAHDLVAGRLRAIPGAFECHEGMALIFRRKLVALIEHEVQDGGVCLEQQIRRDCLVDLLGRAGGEAGLRMPPDIRIWPVIESALLYMSQIVRWQPVAKPIAFPLHDPQLPGVLL